MSPSESGSRVARTADDIWPAAERATQAAHEVLRNNLRGPCAGLPRAAAWGYPEPYTRDILISGLAALATQDENLMDSLRLVLETLARNQSPLGLMPSLVHDASDLGASDTTPLFLMVLAFYRRVTGESDFLREAADKALVWMDYRSSESRVIVDQQPTTDWRDELWVPGYGLYVNSLVYTYLRAFREQEKATRLYERMHRLVAPAAGIENKERSVGHGGQNTPPLSPRLQAALRHQKLRGLLLGNKPYFALWAFKEYSSDRFDLMGNSLAILSGLAPPDLAGEMVVWIETECRRLRARMELTGDLPPCLFPYQQHDDWDYRPRIERLNPPGCYANGGIWPFICGLYVAALVAADRLDLARKKLAALTALVSQAKNPNLEFGFNEWHRAQDGLPQGQDWQTWSAALFLYAVECVRRDSTPLFDEVRRD
jgi:hypothetical protein